MGRREAWRYAAEVVGSEFSLDWGWGWETVAPDRLKCKGNKSIAEKVIIIKILTTTYPKAIIYPVLARNKVT